MKKSISLMCTVGLIGLAQVCYGEYRLKDAIESAKTNNFGMHITKTDLDKAQLSRAEAVAGFWPKIDATASMSKQASKYDRYGGGQVVEKNSIDKYNFGNEPTLQRTGIQIEQELFTGGSTVFGMLKVEKGLQSADFQYQSKTISLLLEVIQAYQDVLWLRQTYRIKTNEEAAARESLEKFEAKFNASEITKTEVSSARVSLADAMAQKEEIFGAMKNKEAFFAYKVGVEPTEDLSMIDYAKLSIPKSLEELLALVKQGNPEVAAAQYTYEAAKYDVKISESRLLPRVTANMSLNRANSSDRKGLTNAGYNYNQASIDISLPIFNRGLNITDIKKSKYALRRSDLELQDKEANITNKTIEVWSEYQTSKARIVSTREAEVAAHEAYEGMKEEFLAGTKSSLDLLRSESDVFRMQLMHERAQRQLVLSVFQIRALIGDLDKVDFTGI